MTPNSPDWVLMSGGAARGAFMLGALDVLVNERGMRPRHFAGISIGALLAVELAQAPDDGLPEVLASLKELWLRELPSRMRWGRRRSVLRALLEQRFDGDALRRSGRSFRGGAVDLRSGRFVACTEVDVDVERLLGMTAVPLLHRPVRIGDQLWVDGVLRHVVPLHEALAAAPEHMLILTAGAPTLAKGRGHVWRMLQIIGNELAFVKELRTAVALCLAGGPRVEILTPSEELPGPLRFDADSLSRSFEHGCATARGDGWRWARGMPPPSYAPYCPPWPRSESSPSAPDK